MASETLITVNIPKKDIEYAYWERIRAYYLEHYKADVDNGPWSAKAIHFIIQQLLYAEELQSRNPAQLEDKQLYLLTKYEVIKDNMDEGTQYLVLNRKQNKSNRVDIRRILSVQDCLYVFNVIYEGLPKKCVVKETVKYSLRNYVFPRKFLQIFFDIYGLNTVPQVIPESGKYPDKSEVRTLAVRARTGLLDIVKSFRDQKHDDYYSYLIIYVDDSTGFAVLRPLVNYSSIEVTKELFQIFMEYGIPAKVVIHNFESKKYWDTVYMQLKQLLPNNLVTCELKKSCLYNVVPETKTIMEDLDNWMANGGSCWSIGCYITQWKYNNKKNFRKINDAISLKSKYELFFPLDHKKP